MIKQKAAFVKADRREKEGKVYRSVTLMIEGASEALRFPVEEEIFAKASGLKSLQFIVAQLQIDARFAKGDWSARPTLNLLGFEVAQ